MSDHSSQGGSGGDWYELFSRGARDWLRHNEKVREAVRGHLPELISGADVIGSDGERKVQVPVRLLEHYRFRLATPSSQEGTGQGKVKPGDVLAEPTRQGGREGKGQGGEGEGGLQFVLELKVDEIVDWLWEELQLPHLKMKEGAAEDADFVREGWDRRGARSRLDRRRSLKEAIKRRSIQTDGPVFSNEDLRFRQLVKRDRPATRAVVFFALDVSSSMADRDRRLAKTFFFWVIQGLRRQYAKIEPVFIAHTVQAWEFEEGEFFKVRGSGGTVASTAFNKALEVIEGRFDPSRYNIYLFYASDGENFSHDREVAREALGRLGGLANYMGYVETAGPQMHALRSETAALFTEAGAQGAATGSYVLAVEDDVWTAIRGFFQHEATGEED